MRTRIFCLLLLMTGGIMFAQISATKSLSISVTPPPSSTGSLLTGKTPANYSLPSGWSLLCRQDWESFSNGASGASCIAGNAPTVESNYVVSSDFSHGGSKALKTDVPYGSPGGGSTFSLYLPAGKREVYLSWYERLDSFPNGVGYYNLGADWYKANFLPVGGGAQATFNGSMGPDPPYNTVGSFGFSSVKYILQRQGMGGDDSNLYMGTRSANFDGAWHQWEVHYKASTGGTYNTDGTIEMWLDGVLLNSLVGRNTAGTIDMNGMRVEIGGHNGVILWLKNASSQAQCNALMDSNGPFTCGTAPGDGYGCDPTYRNWSFARVNAACSGMAPPNTYNRYIDDVIELYK